AGEAVFEVPGGFAVADENELVHGAGGQGGKRQSAHSRIAGFPTKVDTVSFFIENWTLIAVALVSGGLLVWPAVKGGGRTGSLNPADAVTLMNRSKAVVIDLSEAKAFAEGHIIGAKNVPMEELEAKLPGMVKNKAATLIFVCPNGARA